MDILRKGGMIITLLPLMAMAILMGLRKVRLSLCSLLLICCPAGRRYHIDQTRSLLMLFVFVGHHTSNLLISTGLNAKMKAIESLVF